MTLVDFLSGHLNSHVSSLALDDAGNVTALEVRSYARPRYGLWGIEGYEVDENEWRRDLRSVGMLRRAHTLGGEQAVRALLGLPTTMGQAEIDAIVQRLGDEGEG